MRFYPPAPRRGRTETPTVACILPERIDRNANEVLRSMILFCGSLREKCGASSGPGYRFVSPEIHELTGKYPRDTSKRMGLWCLKRNNPSPVAFKLLFAFLNNGVCVLVVESPFAIHNGHHRQIN